MSDHTFAQWARIVRKFVHPARSSDVDSDFLSYNKFIEAVGEAPANCYLQRIDSSKPYSVDNVEWVRNV